MGERKSSWIGVAWRIDITDTEEGDGFNTGPLGRDRIVCKMEDSGSWVDNLDTEPTPAPLSLSTSPRDHTR